MLTPVRRRYGALRCTLVCGCGGVVGARETALATGSFTLGLGSLSPDGTTVVYVDGGDLRVVPANGGASRLLVSGAAPVGVSASNGVFLADSKTVLFGALSELRSIALDGSSATILLATASGDAATVPGVAVSPDFSQVATISACGTEFPALRVYARDALPAACTSGRIVASMSTRRSNVPAWGPSGKIAFDDDRDVWLVDAQTGAMTNLTQTMTSASLSAGQPTWMSGCANLQ
jgi:Tol biopolymer transport system component